MGERRHSARQLSELTGLPLRTIRYYVQEGLVERPVGQTRSAHYTDDHLADLAQVRQLAEGGLRLERIRAIMEARRNERRGVLPASPADLEVWTHLRIAEGVRLLVSPAASGIATEDLRGFLRGVAKLYQDTIQRRGGG